MNIRSNSKVSAIFEATLELIAENGLHATPMSLISKRSGVSAGAIYHYFESKEVLINALYVEVKKELMDAALAGYDIRASYRDRFFLLWTNYFNYLLAHPAGLSFIEQCSFSPLITGEVQEICNRHLAPMIEFIMTGIEAGHLKRLDLQLILSLVNGAVISTAKLKLSGKMNMTDLHRDAAAQTCWDGLKAE